MLDLPTYKFCETSKLLDTNVVGVGVAEYVIAVNMDFVLLTNQVVVVL